MKLELNLNTKQQVQARRLLIELIGPEGTGGWAQSLRGTHEKQGIAAITEGGDVVAAAIYEMAEQPQAQGRQKICLLRSMQGASDHTGINWALHLGEFEEHMRKQGVNRIIIQGRNAWQKLAKDGWKTIFVAISKEI